MEKLKVTFLYSAAGFGGIVRNLGYIVNGFNPDKFDIHVILLSDNSSSESVPLIENSSVRFLRMQTAGTFDADTIADLAAYLKFNEIDVLSCHGYKADVFGWILRFFCRVPVQLLTIAHGWVTPGVKLQCYYVLDKLVIRFFDRIVFVSEEQLARNRWWFFPGKKVSVVNNAIDLDKFLGSCSRRDEFRQTYGFKNDDRILGFVGRLSPEKDIAALIHSLHRLNGRGYRLKALIVGDGPQLDELKQLAYSLGLADAVVFAGYVTDTLPMYQAMDIFVTCSHREGLPNSLLEAQAVGVPCVASAVGGHTDVIVKNETGQLFQLGNNDELDEKIIDLVNQSQLRQRIGQGGHDRVKSVFSLRDRIAKLEKLYWQVGHKRANV